MKNRIRPSLAILGTRGIPARYGGFETFAEQLAVRLVQRGIDMTVFCEEQGQPDPPDSYRGVKLRYVKAPALGPLSTIIFDIRCLWMARKAYDVTYMLGYGAGLFFFIPRLWGRDVWVNMDGIEWYRSKWSLLAKAWLRFMERAATWTSTRLIADAEGIREHLERRYKYLPDISVIPYGAFVVEDEPSVGYLDEYALRANEYYLIVCRLEPENHVLEILEGYLNSDARHPIVVIGDSALDTPYVRHLKSLPDDRLRFVGTVFDQEKLQALRWHCRAYFHGHSVGGTNPSLLEALGCGNFVIAHDNTFNREVAGECARYFSGAKEIPSIVEILDSEAAPITQRKNAQARITAKYNWTLVADAYENLLEK